MCNNYLVNEQMVAMAYDETCGDCCSVKRLRQKEAVLRYLEEGRILDQVQAVKEMNCWRLSARIVELRKEGWNIESAYLKSGFKGYWLGKPARIFYNSSIGQLPLFLEEPLNKAELVSQGLDAIEIHEEESAFNQSFHKKNEVKIMKPSLFKRIQIVPQRKDVSRTSSFYSGHYFSPAE